MSKEEDTGGIIIKINPEYKIRQRTKKLASTYLRLAFFSLAASILIILLMICCKDKIQSYIAGDEHFSGLDNFFNLDSQIQWVIVWGLNGWAVFEVLFNLALKGFVNNELPKWLKVWLVVYSLDCILALLIIAVILYYVALLTKIFLAIIIILAVLYEIYFLNTLIHFIKIISKNRPYEHA